ncbi:MAG: chromate resistance protein ChrB [Actinomycetota bacterium]|nr:chromate resistance protein ChrB [Actinomycetota bacterium]
MPWRILTYRLEAEGSRHRVAIWRELRKAGAVSLQNGTWAIPPGTGFDPAVDRATSLIQRAEGQALIFEVTPAPASAAALEGLHVGEREEEWGEFVADCAKYDAEIASEIAKEKFTLAELDEEEQSLDRLRRWYREIRSRDVFGAPSQELAERRLKECAEVLEDFANRVYEARQRP